MQPFQCDLQPQLQETHRTTHTGKSILAKPIGGTNRVRNDPSRNRRTDEVPFIVACNHFTRKNTRFRALASSPKHSPCDIHAAIPMRSATTASRNAQNYAHRKKHSCKTHRRNQSRPERPQPQPPHRRGTFHRRLQPLYTEKHNVSCSGFLPNTKPMQHHAAIPMRSATTDSMQPPTFLPFFTTSLLHHFPSSSLPFFTTPLHHHFPSSPLPFIITSLLHHSPSSSLPFFTTSLHDHFPSSPLPFFTTSLLHHFYHPSSRSISLLLM